MGHFKSEKKNQICFLQKLFCPHVHWIENQLNASGSGLPGEAVEKQID